MQKDFVMHKLSLNIVPTTYQVWDHTYVLQHGVQMI